MSDDLVVWLRAQLDDEEEWARACTPGPWQLGIVYGTVIDADRGTFVRGVGEAEATHIARHDPARVLREVAAKRAILERHSPRQLPTAPDGYVVCDWCDVGPPPRRHVPWPCPDVINLVAGYADQPGYRDEWKP